MLPAPPPSSPAPTPRPPSSADASAPLAAAVSFWGAVGWALLLLAAAVALLLRHRGLEHALDVGGWFR